MLDLWLAFSAGVLSSLHCIGMCGPIVMGCVSAQKPIEISLSGTVAVTSVKVGQVMPHVFI